MTGHPVSSGPVAVIADIVGSRSHPDRAALQHRIEQALQADTAAVSPLEPFAATFADEFQAVYASLPDALAATLLVQLGLDEGASLRFGLGLGATSAVPSRTSDRIQDGPGWWHAREAIEQVEELQSRQPAARTRFRGPDPAQQAVTNAYLLLRDQLLETMSVRARGYARGMAQGMPQSDIAAQFGVSQSAVSQSLRRTGALPLLDGLDGLNRSTAAGTSDAAGAP